MLNPLRRLLSTPIFLGLISLLLIAGGIAVAPLLSKTPPPADHPRLSDADLLEIAYQQTPNPGRPIPPIPEQLPLNPQEIALGQQLFFDPHLSSDNHISCASCHRFNKGGADPRPASLGVQGKKGELNSPTVFNAVFNFAQFWDGRAKDLQQQAEGPLLNPIEMGNPDWPTLIQKLQALPNYQQAFQNLYPDQGLTKDTLTYTIAQFERSLITPNSPFDRYLKGDLKALSPQAKAGYRLFQQKGCIACHNGINIGGNLYQKAGVYDPIAPNALQKKWLGRYNITHNPSDKFYLKVPTLRNIAQTAPYFHDGSAPTLEQAIQTMAKAQLGTSLEETEIQKIKAFLDSLTGEYQGVPLNEL